MKARASDETMAFPKAAQTGTVWLARMLAMATLFGLLLPPAAAAAGHSNELYDPVLKANYLYHFAKFVDWPSSVTRDASMPFTICVVGEHQVARQLWYLVRDKSLYGHELLVREVGSEAAAQKCRILFIPSSQWNVAGRWMDDLQSTSVLTVGDIPGFCERGGIVNFWSDSGRLRFEINPRAAESAHLNLSSKLLRLARIVGENTSAGGAH